MILIPILALMVGIALGAILSVDVPITQAPYLAVTILAGLDSVFGGSRSIMEGKFQTNIFLTGFLANILVGMFLIWLGNGIGVSMLTVAALVFAFRIFTNLSLIRRMILTRMDQKRENKRIIKADSALEQSTNP